MLQADDGAENEVADQKDVIIPSVDGVDGSEEEREIAEDLVEEHGVDPVLVEVRDLLTSAIAPEKESPFRAVSALSNATLQRWLYSRSFDKARTVKALLRHLAWRDAENVNFITSETVKKELDTNLIAFAGPDKENGRPCVFAFVSNHDKSLHSKEEMSRFIVYIIETALKRGEELRQKRAKDIIDEALSNSNGEEECGDKVEVEAEVEEDKEAEGDLEPCLNDDTFTLVFDLEGFGLSCMNYDAIVTLINVAQYNYPYVIEKVIIVNAPFVFGACWQVISPFLPSTAAALIGFANNNEELEQFILKENVPTIESSGVKAFVIDDDAQEEED